MAGLSNNLFVHRNTITLDYKITLNIVFVNTLVNRMNFSDQKDNIFWPIGPEPKNR
ncbi:hypothetical protein ES707_17949 [subsurface metagenome]